MLRSRIVTSGESEIDQDCRMHIARLNDAADVCDVRCTRWPRSNMNLHGQTVLRDPDVLQLLKLRYATSSNVREFLSYFLHALSFLSDDEVGCEPDEVVLLHCLSVSQPVLSKKHLYESGLTLYQDARTALLSGLNVLDRFRKSP